MRFKTSRLLLAASLVLALAAVSCAPRYEFKPVPLLPMSSYPSQVSLPEAKVGAKVFYDTAELKQVFGFNLKDAGVIPVQVLVDNQSQNSITILQAILTDAEGQLWEVLPANVVYQRLEEHTSGGSTLGQGARRTFLWSLAAGALGAAVGVVTGTDVGAAAGKGAAVGAAIGVASTIAGAGLDGDKPEELERDFGERSFDHATIEPGQSSHGLLYFPTEAKDPKGLTLSVQTGSTTERLEFAF
ncbi:MAG: hypothetical protein LBT62_07315 [Deltaproteobacteria bacterium]|jgi:hypothetical protein|nr:hypothetical protein [Deltaproteobacteria bacterium]